MAEEETESKTSEANQAADAETPNAAGGTPDAGVGNSASDSEPARQKTSVVPVAFKTDAGKDPLRVLADLATATDLSDDDKSALIAFGMNRFRHRRTMAYIALFAVLGSMALTFLGAFVDGVTGKTCVIDSLGDDASSLIIWVDGFLATIVAAYYGVSAWRPSS